MADVIEVTPDTEGRPEHVQAAGVFRDSLRQGLSTPHQRLALRCEFSAQDYPTDRVTVRHQQLFDAVDIPWEDGAPMGDTLEALTRAQAGELYRLLKGRA